MRELYEFKEEDAYNFARCVNIETFRKGDELHFKYCPYCHGGSKRDKNTFAINLTTGAWNCKRGSCGQTGNMIRLAQDFAAFSLGDGIDDYYLKRERFRRFARPKPIESNDKAIEYLKKRGIPEAVTRKYEITIKEGTNNVMVFPFIDENGNLWFVKYRNIEYVKGVSKGGKEWCEPNRKPILFGMNQCNFENKTLVMTEGQIDSLSCAAAGIENAVSVPTGKNGFTWHPHCFSFLSRFDELIIFGDYENGEISLLTEMRARFRGRVKHVRPEDYKGHKDANEILLAEGKQAIIDAIQNAVPAPNPRIKPLCEVVRKDWMDAEHFDSGLKTLDNVVGGLYLGQLVTLTGQRGLGKSTLASQFGAYAIKAGYKVFFYSGELNDWQFQAWFERQIAGPENVDGIRMKNGFVRYVVNERKQHDIVEWYKDLTYIYDNHFIAALSEEAEKETLTDTIKTAIQQYGCQVIFIDNLMTAMTDDGGSDIYRAQSRFVKELAAIAKGYEVLVILIAHPRKTSRELENDDISGSGDISNLADLVLSYGKPKEKEAVNGVVRTLTIMKNRMNGRTERIMLHFDEASKRIAEDEDGLNFLLGWEDDEGLMAFTEADPDEIPF